MFSTITQCYPLRFFHSQGNKKSRLERRPDSTGAGGPLGYCSGSLSGRGRKRRSWARFYGAASTCDTSFQSLENFHVESSIYRYRGHKKKSALSWPKTCSCMPFQGGVTPRCATLHSTFSSPGHLRTSKTCRRLSINLKSRDQIHTFQTVFDIVAR